MSLCHDVNTHEPTTESGFWPSHSIWPAVSLGSSGVTLSRLSMFLPMTVAGSETSTRSAVTHEKIDVLQVPVAHGVLSSQKTGPVSSMMISGMPAEWIMPKYSQYSWPRSSLVLLSAVTPLTSRHDQRTPAGVKCGRRSSIAGTRAFVHCSSGVPPGVSHLPSEQSWLGS